MFAGEKDVVKLILIGQLHLGQLFPVSVPFGEDCPKGVLQLLQVVYHFVGCFAVRLRIELATSRCLLKIVRWRKIRRRRRD